MVEDVIDIDFDDSILILSQGRQSRSGICQTNAKCRTNAYSKKNFQVFF